MVDNARVRSRPRRRHGLPAVAIVAAAVLALAACGSGGSPSSADGSPHAGAATNSPSAVAYSACMRSNGVPTFPDPDSKGNPPQADPQLLGVSSSRLQAAQTACQPLYPNNGSLQQQTQQCVSTGDCPQTLLQQLLTVERSYAQCMRSHGVPTWPDPTVGAKGRPVFDLSRAGIDPQSTDSSQFQAKEAECRSLVGGTVPNLPVT